jgi:hypothetical protein
VPPAESRSFANDPKSKPFLEGLVAAIRDGYDAIARGDVVDAKDMFVEYGLDWDAPIVSLESTCGVDGIRKAACRTCATSDAGDLGEA